MTQSELQFIIAGSLPLLVGIIFLFFDWRHRQHKKKHS